MKAGYYKLLKNYVATDQIKRPRVSLFRYVGIEIECFGDCEHEDIYAEALEHDLENYLNVGNDHSIAPPDYENTFELRLLIPEYKLEETLLKFGKMFRKLKLKTNKTCGLHVHLDCRNRPLDKVVERLTKFQDVLFALVKRDRWSNEFCKWKNELNSNTKYVAINTLPYSEYKTVEVRLHHGTTNTKDIYYWVKLLIKIIDTPRLKKVSKKKDILTWKFKDNGELKTYVDRKFKDSWFDRKKVG